jgi:hypothetical protein
MIVMISPLFVHSKREGFNRARVAVPKTKNGNAEVSVESKLSSLFSDLSVVDSESLPFEAVNLVGADREAMEKYISPVLAARTN